MIKPYRILDWWLARRRRATRRPGQAWGVLVIAAGGLGDTVLFAHVADRFRALARVDEPVTVLLRSDAIKMAFLLPPDVRARSVDFGRLRRHLGYRREIMEEIFRDHFRLVIHADYLRHPELDEALVAAAMAPETAAMEPRPWPKYASALGRNRRLYARVFDSGGPRVDKLRRWAAFADWLAGTPSPPPTTTIPPARLPRPASERAVIVQPFSAARAKQSPPALYRRLIAALPEMVPGGTPVVVTGGPGDLESNPEFRALLDLPGVRFDGSAFADLVPLLRAARLVVSVDTALMHLAVAVGAPTLCLASAAYVGEIVPYDPAVAPANVRFVYHSMPCEGCLGTCVLPAENGMFPCVARLDEGRIMAAAKDLLAEGAAR